MNLTELLLHSKYPFRELSECESQKLKSVLLDIYKDIITVCSANDLTVVLVGGSALGAVRHNGYIPWDDDLDVAMPRVDYDRLPTLLSQMFPGKYECSGAGFSENPVYGFLKVQKSGTILKTLNETEYESPCIAIDVFPIENIPNNKFVRLMHGSLVNLLLLISVCVKLYERKQSPLTEILLADKEGRKSLKWRFRIGRVFGFIGKSSKWYTKCDMVAQHYKNNKTKYVSIPTGRGHYFSEIQRWSSFFPPLKHSFECIESSIPNDFDKYLSSIYGDYMQIPPLEKREKHFILEIDFGS